MCMSYLYGGGNCEESLKSLGRYMHFLLIFSNRMALPCAFHFFTEVVILKGA